MAKVGNEAKLILRLAKERALTEEVKQTRLSLGDRLGVDAKKRDGFIDGLNWYGAQLNSIVLELEAK